MTTQTKLTVLSVVCATIAGFIVFFPVREVAFEARTRTEQNYSRSGITSPTFVFSDPSYSELRLAIDDPSYELGHLSAILSLRSQIDYARNLMALTPFLVAALLAFLAKRRL